MADVKTTVIHKTEMVRGKECPLTITKQVGLQEIMVGGELTLVESVTILDGPLGTPRCYTRARAESAECVGEAAQSRIREVATKAMIDQGIW